MSITNHTIKMIAIISLPVTFHILASPEFCTQSGKLAYIERISDRHNSLVLRLMGLSKDFSTGIWHNKTTLHFLSFLSRNTWRAPGDGNILARV